jgi:hypothetical protein
VGLEYAARRRYARLIFCRLRLGALGTLIGTRGPKEIDSKCRYRLLLQRLAGRNSSLVFDSVASRSLHHAAK